MLMQIKNGKMRQVHDAFRHYVVKWERGGGNIHDRWGYVQYEYVRTDEKPTPYGELKSMSDADVCIIVDDYSSRAMAYEAIQKLEMEYV